MPIDPSAPENQSRLPHQRLVERSIPGIENASPEQLIRADGVGACPLREERQPCRWWARLSLSMLTGTAGVRPTSSDGYGGRVHADEAIIHFLRTSGAEWFDVPRSNGERRFTYATELRPAARRRGLDWSELEPRLRRAVEECGGAHRDIRTWSLWRGIVDRLAGRTQAYWTTYFELPRQFFR